MFKPVEFYINEKKAKNMDKDSIIQEWSKLTAKQQLKYIKQAEVSYDKFAEVIVFIFNKISNILIIKKQKKENKKEAAIIKPFNYFLHKSELQLLFESYELPEKLPQLVL